MQQIKTFHFLISNNCLCSCRRIKHIFLESHSFSSIRIKFCFKRKTLDNGSFISGTDSNVQSPRIIALAMTVDVAPIAKDTNDLLID